MSFTMRYFYVDEAMFVFTVADKKFIFSLYCSWNFITKSMGLFYLPKYCRFQLFYQFCLAVGDM